MYEEILNNCLQGICIIVNCKFEYVNNGFLNIFEYENVDINGLTIKDIVTDNDKDSISCIEDGIDEPKICEYQGVTKTGNTKYIRCYITPITWNGKCGKQALIVDITKEKLKENEHELIYETVNENVAIGLWRVSPDGNLIYANRHFMEILEDNYKNLQGKKFYRFFDAKALRCFTGSQKMCEEVEVVLDEGIKKWIKITAAPTSDGGNVGTIIDITKNKTVIPELIKLRDELKQERVNGEN